MIGMLEEQAELPHVAFFAPISPTLCFLKQLAGRNRCAFMPSREVMIFGLNNLVESEGGVFGFVAIALTVNITVTTVEVACHSRHVRAPIFFN